MLLARNTEERIREPAFPGSSSLGKSPKAPSVHCILQASGFLSVSLFFFNYNRVFLFFLFLSFFFFLRYILSF